MLLHQGQELDNDLGGRTDQHLALTALLSIVDVVEAIVQDGNTDHFVYMLCSVMRDQIDMSKERERGWRDEYQSSHMSVTIRNSYYPFFIHK